MLELTNTFGLLPWQELFETIQDYVCNLALEYVIKRENLNLTNVKDLQTSLN